MNRENIIFLSAGLTANYYPVSLAHYPDEAFLEIKPFNFREYLDF